MLKRLIAIGVLVTFPLAAQADPVRDCLEATFEVAKTAQSKQPSEAQIKQLEEQIVRIEGMCDGQQFSEAETARQELAQMIAQM